MSFFRLRFLCAGEKSGCRSDTILYRAPFRPEKDRTSITPSSFAPQDRTVRYFVIMILSESGPAFPVCRIPVSYYGNYTMPNPAVSSRGEKIDHLPPSSKPGSIPLRDLLRELPFTKNLFSFFKNLLQFRRKSGRILSNGEVLKRSKRRDSKSRRALIALRGFKSHLLRQNTAPEAIPGRFFMEIELNKS